MKKPLMDLLQEIPDPRRGNGIRHKFEEVLLIAILAILSEAKTYAEMELFGEIREEWLRSFLELPNGIPSHDTFGDIISMIHPQELHKAFARWVEALREYISNEVIAIDGKTIRRSKDVTKGKRALHVVSGWANENQMVLGQLAVEEKSNEITAIPALLKLLHIKGCIVTIDAIGTQKEIAADIIDGGGNYLLQVKDNQKTLREDISYYLEQEVMNQPKEKIRNTTGWVQTKEKSHGRIETRTCYVTEDIDWLPHKMDWKNLAGIGIIVSERLVGDKKTIEKSYFIYSQKGATAKEFLHYKRSHWSIENTLHWSLDVNFREDESRVRAKNGAENFNVLRHLALNLVKKETSIKGSMRSKLKRCGWDHNYLLKVLQVSSNS